MEFLVSKDRDWIEVPGNLCACIDLKSREWTMRELVSDFFVSQQEEAISRELKPVEKIGQVLVERVNDCLKDSVRGLIQNIIGLEHFYRGGDPNWEESKSETALNGAGSNSKIAILFSGGIDSAMIAGYVDELYPPEESIDLINIVFQKDAADRKTGLEAYQELQQRNPKRRFNLILVDKTLEDLQQHEENLLDLIYPKQTHMDFNIAMILHIASQGEGVLYPTEKRVKSSARIYLSGLGADEIFGGYSRYKNAFRRGGFGEQLEEMRFGNGQINLIGVVFFFFPNPVFSPSPSLPKKDMNRLWIRNLGRDDRCISDNSVEVRFPFLDLELARFVWSQDIASLTDFSESGMKSGLGSKRLLRHVALHCGLKVIAGYPKKAI